ncbi:MAG: arsenic efflux protein, partial [Lachnospiraceae bacterium]|nr:arsenic efflux protein [Lachnospiraceae bacterium]
MLDILLDALIDTAKLLPFLFATYLAMEYLEHKTSVKVLIAVQKAGNFGPLIGGALGAVPQCGFSAAASSLYAGKIISIGTLIAIYLSTSDEMLPMLISEKAPAGFILSVIGVKLLIGIFWGFLCDLVFFRNENAHEHINIHTMCEEEHCHCDKGIWGSAL